MDIIIQIVPSPVIDKDDAGESQAQGKPPVTLQAIHQGRVTDADEADEEEEQPIKEKTIIMDQVVGGWEVPDEKREKEHTRKHEEVDPSSGGYPVEQFCEGRTVPVMDHPTEKGSKHKIIHKQVSDEPEVVPTEVSIGVGLEAEDGGIEVPITACKPVMDPFQVYLRGHDDEHACGQGNEETPETEADKACGAPFLQHEPGNGAGNEEKQGHPEPAEPEIKLQQQITGLVILQVPAPFCHIWHG